MKRNTICCRISHAALGVPDEQFEPQNETWNVLPMFKLETSDVHEEIPIPQTRIINVGMDTTTAQIYSSGTFLASSFSVKLRDDDELEPRSDFTPRNMRIIEQVSPARVVCYWWPIP